MTDDALSSRLFNLLDQAQQLASEYTGGYSNNFLSAEEFHLALAESVQHLKEGDRTQLRRLSGWFAPTCDWDDFIGMEGVGLANEIFELLSKMAKE